MPFNFRLLHVHSLLDLHRVTCPLILLILSVLTISSISRSQSTYYVAKNGSNSNPGTAEKPFLTIAKGVSVLGPGKTLSIRAGTYVEGLINTIPGGVSWSNPVTVAAYPAETVTLRPAGGEIVFLAKGANKCYIILDGLILDGVNTSSSCVRIIGGHRL